MFVRTADRVTTLRREPIEDPRPVRLRAVERDVDVRGPTGERRAVSPNVQHGARKRAFMHEHLTRRRMEDVTPVVVDPAKMTEAQKFDHYRGLIEQNGGKVDTRAEQRNLVSLRTPTSTRANGGHGKYDDKTVMLWQDAQGGKHVREYKSNTDPSARFEGQFGGDGDGDGRLDLARLPAGHYQFRAGHSDHLGRILRPTKSTGAELDVNHDGKYSAKDGKHRFGNAGTSMLFHAGADRSTGSAGCQTMPPAEFERFWKDLHRGGDQGAIGYTLIND